MPPGEVEKVNDVLASPQEAQQLKQELAEVLQGVVQESSVQIGPDNKTVVGGSEGKKLPDNPAGTVAFELEGKQQIDEHTEWTCRSRSSEEAMLGSRPLASG